MAAAPEPVQFRIETTAFDHQVAQVFRVTGSESISQLFDFVVDFGMPADAAALSADEILLTDIGLVMLSEGEEGRTIHGIIAGLERRYELDDKRGRVYRLHLVPHAHTLKLAKTQDIFLDTTIPQLVAEKLALHGLEQNAVSMLGLNANYASREFVVQFDETDLAFISRLTEHLGISFFFDQSSGTDRIVFCDSNSGFGTADSTRPLTLHKRDEGVGLFELKSAHQLIPAVFMMMDYNYRTPNADLSSAHESETGNLGGVVEWGAHHKSLAEGNALAKVRAEESESTQHIFEGLSNDCSIAAGHSVIIEGHADLDGLELLVTEVVHEASTASEMGLGAEQNSPYRNRFKAIARSQTYRPPRRTAKPRIAGLITGVVEPKDVDELEGNPKLDANGRYRIKFLFDTVPLGERQASHPVRQAQPSVGPNHGMHFPLRPGIEVVLGFVNGDPDRPIVVGALHNARTPSHVTTKNALENVVQTASGVRMVFRDGPLKS